MSLYPLLVIAFCLPLFPKLLPALIIVWFITWFIDEPVGNKVDRIGSNKFIWWFMAFYLMHMVAMFYSSNKPSGWFDLEVKTSLWLFPVLFAGASRLIHEKLDQVFHAFIVGCIVASLYCLWHVFQTNDSITIDSITYTRLSVLLHPAYFAMYISIAMAYMMFQLTGSKHKSTINILFYFFCLLFFASIIYLLSSKAGIFSAFLAIILPLLFQMNKKKRLIYLGVIVISSFILLIGVLNNSRFSAMLHAQQEAAETHTTGESTALRLLIWQATLDIIIEQPLLGVGTGDIKDELTNRYEELNITSAATEKLNVHNQFLETWLGQGIIGISLLLIIFYSAATTASKQKDMLMVSFLIIMTFNFFFESMLNTQAGVVFFAFMSGLFYIRLKKVE